MFDIIKILKDILSGIIPKKETEFPFEGLRTYQNVKTKINKCELTDEQINKIVNDSLNEFTRKNKGGN